MLPDKATMFLSSVEDALLKDEKRSFWDKVDGVDKSCLTSTGKTKPLIDVVPIQ